jgi:hypothetical protein
MTGGRGFEVVKEHKVVRRGEASSPPYVFRIAI